MKKIIVLGSTGSIGKQTLEIASMYPDKFEVVGISCNKNFDLILEQIKKFKPKYVAVTDCECAKIVKENLQEGTVLFAGVDAMERLVEVEADIVVTAIVGLIGLKPTIRAIECKKNIALANKETLVACGSFVMELAKKNNVKIIPVDSEHSAIWQCLQYGRAKGVSKLILTASGGPFRQLEKDKFSKITKIQALTHPTWNMGAKVTIDSATMINKGLEVIEAMHLFCVDIKKIDVVIHPQSIIHSMVEFEDSSIVAELSKPSMILPIQLALTYPEKCPTNVERLDFSKIKSLDFEIPDLEKFECLKIAREAGEASGIMPAAMNSANEKCVELFLKDIIKFYQIPYYITKALDRIKNVKNPTVAEVLEMDIKTRALVEELVRR